MSVVDEKDTVPRFKTPFGERCIMNIALRFDRSEENTSIIQRQHSKLLATQSRGAIST